MKSNSTTYVSIKENYCERFRFLPFEVDDDQVLDHKILFFYRPFELFLIVLKNIDYLKIYSGPKISCAYTVQCGWNNKYYLIGEQIIG